MLKKRYHCNCGMNTVRDELDVRDQIPRLELDKQMYMYVIHWLFPIKHLVRGLIYRYP